MNAQIYLPQVHAPQPAYPTIPLCGVHTKWIAPLVAVDPNYVTCRRCLKKLATP